MLKKTHLAIGLGAALYFLPHVSNKLIFIPLVLLSTLLPDLDSGLSRLKNKNSPTLSIPRGILHTYTVCIAVSIILTFFYPLAALPFFIGYSFHLLADSFTVNGIRPFWPFKVVSSGNLKTGGKTEDIIFFGFVIADSILMIALFLSA